MFNSFLISRKWNMPLIVAGLLKLIKFLWGPQHMRKKKEQWREIQLLHINLNKLQGKFRVSFSVRIKLKCCFPEACVV